MKLAIYIIAIVAVIINIIAVIARISKKEKSIPRNNQHRLNDWRPPEKSDASTCIMCGMILPPHSDVCQHCGTKNVASSGEKICPVCNAHMFKVDTFCGECGARL